MASAEQSIFRESAMKHYIEGREQNVLLRLASPPVFKFLWILLPLFLSAIVFTWSVQVPVLVTGQGVVIEQAMNTGKTGQATNTGGTAQIMSTGGTAQATNTGGTGQATNTGKPKQATNTGATGQATNTGKPKQATNTGGTGQGTNTGATGQGQNNGKTGQGQNNKKIKQGQNNGKIKQGQNNGQTGQTINNGNVALASFNQNSGQGTNSGKAQQAQSGQGTNSGKAQQAAAATEVVALLFLPPEQRQNLHVGEPVKVGIGSGTSSFTGSIARIETGVLSPSDIRTRFNLQGVLAQTISGPSIVVTVQIGPDTSMRSYVGSLCHADVQIGSQSVVTMMPGFDQISALLNGQFFQNLYKQIP